MKVGKVMNKLIEVNGKGYNINKSYINDLAESWIIELLTTDKVQGYTGLLNDGEKYCCLGIYAEFHLSRARTQEPEIMSYKEKSGFSSDIRVLPGNSYKALGLHSSNGTFSKGVNLNIACLKKYGVYRRVSETCRITCIANINDILRWSFVQIAEFMIKNPELVFEENK